MAFILFVGGFHSGKSRLARAWAEAAAPERTLITTWHDAASGALRRAGAHKLCLDETWQRVEEPLEPLCAIRARGPQESSFVLDSLGIWLRNLMSLNLGPGDIARRITNFAAEMAKPDYACAVVSEECGSGVLPSNNIARKYAAILGRANQTLAGMAHSALLVSCGLPLALKGAIPAVLTRFDGKQNN